MTTTKEDNLLKYREEYDFERFKSKISDYEAWGVDPNQCCLWTGYKKKSGYGQFGLSKKDGNTNANGSQYMVMTHRLSYYTYWGEKVPKNLICHIPKIEEGEEGRIVYDNKGNELICLKGCHTPGCVNPLHLYDGTHKQNMKDKEQDGTSWSGRTHTEETKQKIGEGHRKSYKITYNNGTFVIVHNLKKFAEDNEGMKYKSLTKYASNGKPYKKFGILKIEVIDKNIIILD
jgi:hypothetical protein